MQMHVTWIDGLNRNKEIPAIYDQQQHTVEQKK